MAGRRSVWSNKKIIEASKDFVPVTDEVWRLQRGKDAESLHFQEMANEGHYRGEGGTRQGIYVLTATGKLLASINNLNAEKVLEMIERGKEAWKRTRRKERRLPKDFELPRKRWEDSYPDDGLVLRSFNCDLGPNADRNRINRDHVWFSKDEVKGWLPGYPTLGARHRVSSTIFERLARFHLVDNVRGQTRPFAPKEVEGEITTIVTSSLGGVVEFTIQGTSSAKTDGAWKMGKSDWTPKDDRKYPRSVTTTIRGKGTYNGLTRKITKLEFVAVGERKGRSDLSRSDKDLGPAPIGFFFQIAPDRPSERVPPAFIDVYADWVVDPR